MKTTLLLCGLLAAAPQEAGPALSGGRQAGAEGYVTEGVTHPGGDQIFWVPTMAQAEEMSRATGRPIFAMGGV